MQRTVPGTEDLNSKPAQTATNSSPPSAPNKLHLLRFGPFDISSYYEGDVVLIRLELDDDGNPNTDIGIFNIALNGVQWTNGDKI